MSVQTMTHPTPETLAAFNSGALTIVDQAKVEAHISVCDSCCNALGMLSEDRLVGLARKAGAELPPTAGMIDVPDVPPELIDHSRYHVLSQLGAGGMGVVYKAEHRLMGRIVALKVVARKYTSNAAAVERFRREFRAAARLNHPNIVTAHDADEANGLHFLVMEYVEGISLDRLVRKKGPLPVATACQCVRQAALGLQHAFERHMVHRDIKPHNLMVTRKGQVKVLDFGLARVAAETPASPIAGGTDNPDKTVTSASMVMGTPDYLAPEQARNSHEVDIRADIYALGCVLYFLLTGRAPYSKLGSPLEKMLAHNQDEPEAIQKQRDDVPPEVIALISRMMAKNLDDRFATPGEVATALKPFTRPEAIVDEQPEILDSPTSPMDELPTPTIARANTIIVPRAKSKRRKAPTRTRRDRRPLLIAGGVAALLLAVFGVIYGLSGNGKKSNATPVTPIVKGDAVPPIAVASKKRLLFVVPANSLHFNDYEPVRTRLNQAGLEVVTASTTTNACQFDKYGGKRTVTPEKTIFNISTDEFAGVIFCGDVTEFGQNPATDAIRKIVADMRQNAKLVTAICTGQRVLLNLEVLRGKRVAVPNLPQLNWNDFKDADVTGASPGVAIDGQFITASGPDFAVPFAEAIIKELGSE